MGGGTINSVCPSGLARATCAAPIKPVAPGRFSTITGTPNLSDIGGATTRASISTVPPGGAGQTIVIGREGNFSCASAGNQPRHGNTSTAPIPTPTRKWLLTATSFDKRRLRDDRPPRL